MQLWVGLGNPGAKYADTRHNIGFMAVDRIAADHGFGPWRSRFRGEMSEGRFGSARVMLLKPMTFMNLSGESVAEAMRFFKLEMDALTVFHDELDLAPGRLKVKQGGGHAGHNGLRSIQQHLGAEYRRVRMGIGHPGDKRLVSNYVLHDFHKSDAGWLDDELRGICDGAPKLAEGDAGGFMNAVALRLGPPPERAAQRAARKAAKKGTDGGETAPEGGAGSRPAEKRPNPAKRPTGAPKKVDAEAKRQLSHAEFEALSPLEKLKRKFR